MAEFTKEQLIDHIRDMMESSKEMIDGNGVPVEFVVRAERDIAVYEIALAVLTASMEQEPVAWRWFHLKQWHVTNDEAGARNLAWDGVNVTPLYAAPQLPQPAVVMMTFDEWSRKCELQLELCDSGLREKARYIWDEACRAAMLQGAEPVSSRDELPFEQWLSQQTGTIDVECGCVMTEVFYHWLRVAYEAGNSPVITDDVRRMDWLVSKTVDVREPMVYGSHSLFWSQTITDEEDDYHATKLREQIDAAMAVENAAAPQQEVK